MKERSPKYRMLFTNTAVFALSNVLSKVILSLLLPLYTRKLTAAEYGTAELITTVSQLVVPICSLSIQDAVFRFGMDPTKRSASVLKQSLILMRFSAAALLVFSLALHGYAPLQDYFLYFFFISLLSMLRSVFSLYTKAIGCTTIFSIDNIIYNFVLAACNVFLLVVLQAGMNGYLFAMIVANTASILFLNSKTKLYQMANKEPYQKKIFTEMIAYSAPLVLNSIAWGSTHVVDRVMLMSFSSAADTGIYSAASKIPSVISLVAGVFTQAWTISVISDYETERDTHFYEEVFTLLNILVLLASAFVLLLNNAVFPVILGSAFVQAVRFVPVLLIGTVFLTYSNYFSSIYAALRKSKQIMISSLTGGIINAVLNSLMIPRIGVMGACLATSISYAVIAMFRIIDCQRYCPIKIRPVATGSILILLTLLAFAATADCYVGAAFIVTVGAIFICYRRSLRKYLAILKGVLSHNRQK